jgi:quercetin dioxygenase-like cupin family protein
LYESPLSRCPSVSLDIPYAPRYDGLDKTPQREEVAMKIIKINQVPKAPRVSPIFTGPVTMQPIVDTDLTKRFLIQQVNFEKGVRNKLHTHSIEQVLIVTEGKGIVATENEEITVGPGDIIFIAAGEKHWHGAAEGFTFSHLYVMSPESTTTQIEA